MTESAVPTTSSTMGRDLVSAYIATGARVLSWAFVSAIVFRRLGPGAFATLALVRATIGVLNYLSLGLAPAMIARLSTAQGRAMPAIPVTEATPDAVAPLAYADPAANTRPKPRASPIQTLYFSGLVMLLVLAGIGGAVVVQYANLFGDVLNEAHGMRDDVGGIVMVMGIGVLLRLVSDASAAVLQSSGRITTDNLLLAGAEVVWVALSILWIRHDALALIAIAFTCASAALLVARFIAAEQVARLTLLDLDIDWRAGREMLGYGLMVTFAQLADFLYAPVGFLLINQLLSPTDVATFAPAVQIDAALLLLVSGLAGVLLPKAALAHAAGDAATVRAYYVRATMLSAALLLAGAATVWILSPWILRLWLGNDLPATRAILPLVLISTVIGGSGMVGRSILIGIGKVKPFTIAALVAGVANVVLGFVFVKYLGLGLRGIVLATMIVVVARAGVWLPWFVMRTLNLRSTGL